MFRNHPRTRFLVLTAILVPIAAVSTAHADPMTSLYTVTDLGSSSNQTFGSSGPGLSTDANGNSVVLNSSGQIVSPFPQTYTGTSMPTPANFPILDPVPVTGSNAQAFSQVNGVSLYPNGIAIASDQVGVSAFEGGSQSWQRTDIYYVHRNPDGSWGPPVPLMQGTTHYGPSTGLDPNQWVTVSKSGNILESTYQIPGTSVGNSVGVYNINTRTFTNLSTLPSLVNNGYSNFIGDGIDNDGRILMWANHESSNGVYSQDLLLLTPAGISSVPEPASWAVMALAMASFVAHRARERRRRS